MRRRDVEPAMTTHRSHTAARTTRSTSGPIRSVRVALASLALVSLAALGACGSDGSGSGSDDPLVTGPPSTRPGTTASASTDPATTVNSTVTGTGGGWIGGEPDWSSGATGFDDTAGAPTPAGAVPLDSESPDGPATGSPAESATEAGPAKDAGAQAPLRAGSVDDNADFDGFLDYLARFDGLGLPGRAYDPTGRIVATVVGANGLPLDGVDVTIAPLAGGDPVAVLQTAADGRIIFLPAERGATGDAFVLTAEGVSVEAATGETTTLTVERDGGAAAGMPVDVLFLLDVTGSMGDEIEQLTATIADVSAHLDALPQQPDLRFGMTLFRDEGDAFVTATYDFTDDVSAFRAALEDVVADGGGDTPEAVDEAFAAALAEPSWRDPASTVQLVFLVGDAAPQVERDVQQPYPVSIQQAASRGITVHVVAASQTDDPAEHAFREIAQGTGGRFVFLTYGAAGSATGPITDIASTDYEELSLDQLVVRLVGEELAALTGEPFVAPTPASTVPPTDPPGQ